MEKVGILKPTNQNEVDGNANDLSQLHVAHQQNRGACNEMTNLSISLKYKALKSLK